MAPSGSFPWKPRREWTVERADMRKLKRDRLLEAQCEADIVQVVRAYLGEWTPGELAFLPPQSRPGKIRDGEDLSLLAFEVTRARFAAEDWSAAELEDEIKEHVYEYERHMRASRISGGKEVLEIMITGVAELTEDTIKLRLRKIAKLATAFLDRRAGLLREESTAPGRELALIPEAKRAFRAAAET